MSVLPLLLADPLDLWRPSRMHNQQFGLGLDPEDLISPVTAPDLRLLVRSSPYLRSWSTQAAKDDAGSTIKVDKDKLQINLDVQHFAPEEISVKAGEEFITVEGKHEDKKDEHGFISRHFVRRYRLPKGTNLEKIESQLSSDGVLTISAPRVDEKAIEQRAIPVIPTGKPAKVEKKEEKVEEKTEEKKDEKDAIKE